jgi:hypothetical protein
VLEVTDDKIITVYHKEDKAYVATIQMNEEFMEAVKGREVDDSGEENITF